MYRIYVNDRTWEKLCDKETIEETQKVVDYIIDNLKLDYMIITRNKDIDMDEYVEFKHSEKPKIKKL